MLLRKILSDFTKLISLLTPIPTPRSSNDLSLGSLYLLPLVGLVRSSLAVLALVLISLVSRDLIYVETSLVVFMHFVSQGFLHADGLIDFSEALLASRFGRDPYKVMKDVYKGSYAIAVFAIYLLILYSSMLTLLEKLSVSAAALVIVSAEIFSLTTSIPLALLGREAPEGMGRIFKKSLRSRDASLSILIDFLLILLISLLIHMSLGLVIRILIISALSLIFSLIISHLLSSRVLGFVSGDVIGFSIEVAYATNILLAAACIAPLNQ